MSKLFLLCSFDNPASFGKFEIVVEVVRVVLFFGLLQFLQLVLHQHSIQPEIIKVHYSIPHYKWSKFQ